MTPRTRRVITSHALAAVGMSMPWPTILVTIDAATHSALILGLAAAARLAPYVALSWLSGRLADRRERAHIVRLSLAARVGALAACAIALAVDHWPAALAAAGMVLPPLLAFLAAHDVPVRPALRLLEGLAHDVAVAA